MSFKALKKTVFAWFTDPEVSQRSREDEQYRWGC